MNSIPEMVDPVFDVIREVPGCTAPFVCLILGVEEGDIHRDVSAYLGRSDDSYVASYLDVYFKDQWTAVCEAIDWCIEQGTITFSDDGELRATAA